MSFNSSLNITLDSNHDAVFNVSGNERLRIDSLCNVGIGTTSPSTLLHVNGDITASTVNANLTGNVSGSVNGYVGASTLSYTGNVSFNRNYNSYFVKLGIDGGYLSPHR
jgi:hypothetical protein